MAEDETPVTTITFQLQMQEGAETEGGTPDTYRKELRYFAYVDGPEKKSHADIRAAAKEQLPKTYFNLIRTQISVPRRIDFDSIFEVLVEYKHPTGTSRPRPMEAGEVRISVRSEGGSQERLNVSYDAIRVTPGNDPVQLERFAERFIGQGTKEPGFVTQTNNVVVVVELIKPGTLVTQSYLVRCSEAVGKVNGFQYAGYPRGSLRLLNFEASQQLKIADDITPNYTMNFSFHYQRPFSGKIPLYDLGTKKFVETPITAEGHWFIDLTPTKIQQPAAGGGNTIIDAYTSCTLHQVYQYEDFATLFGI